MRSATTAVPAVLLALIAWAPDARAEAPAKKPAATAAADTAPAPPSPAQIAEQAGKALVAVIDADPLELARIVQRTGDLPVRQLLSPATATLTRLAAVRASPSLRAPELALPALTEIAAGRDPELAPAAARAALQIAQQLDAATLARRECPAAALTSVLLALRALGERESAAAHVRAYAWAAVEQLLAAGVPLPAPK